MSGKIERQNDHENIVYEWEDISPYPAQTMEDMAHALWNRGQGDHGTEEVPILWGELVEDDYMQINSDYLLMVQVNMAGEYLDKSLGEDASVTAQELKQTRHSLLDLE